MDNKSELISIYNEDGTIKSKEDFLIEVENLYDEAANQTFLGSFIDEISSPDFTRDIDTTVETFNFLERAIYLTSEIIPEHADMVFNYVKMWNTADMIDGVPKEERVPIKVYINTPGGNLDATFSIIGTFATSETPIHTITYGTGYSGGFFIGICGHRRFATKGSSFLLHEGSISNIGDAHKFFQNTDFYRKQIKQLEDIVIKNTKISKSKYDKRRNDDWFMTAEEALELGIVDEIIENLY